MALLYDFKYHDFMVNNKKCYCKAKLNPLYDIDTGLCIDFGLFKKDNEQSSLISQIPKLSPSDTLVTDAGYFSFKVISDLANNRQNFIMRVKKSACKEIRDQLLIDNAEFDIKINIKGNVFRLLRYYIKEKSYIILTNLFNKTIESIKILYWRRWHIETFFRELKEDHCLNDLNVKNINSLELKLSFIRLIYTILGFLLFGIEKKDAKCSDYTVQVNRTVIKDTLTNYVYKLLFNNNKNIINSSKVNNSDTINEIKKLLFNAIQKSLTYCKKERYFDRKRKSPNTKSYQYYGEEKKRRKKIIGHDANLIANEVLIEET